MIGFLSGCPTVCGRRKDHFLMLEYLDNQILKSNEEVKKVTFLNTWF